jgi:hypothetical protein
MLMITSVLGNVSPDVTWEDVSSAHGAHIVGGRNLSNGESVLFTGATLVLESGDKLNITIPGNGNCHLDGLCTVSETFLPVG